METNTCVILMLMNDRKYYSFYVFIIQFKFSTSVLYDHKGLYKQNSKICAKKADKIFDTKLNASTTFAKLYLPTWANNSILAGVQYIFITKTFAWTLSINVTNVSKTWCADVVLQTLHQNIMFTGGFFVILGCMNMLTWPDPIWIFSMY